MSNYLNDMVRAIFRSFTLFVLVLSMGEGLFLSDWKGIALGTYTSISLIVNFILKELSKKFLGKKGLRPEGARSCGPFISKDEPSIVAKSYGMPSGHSQNFAFFATLLAIGIYQRSKKVKDIYLPIKLGALFMLTAIAMYMRVNIEGCHTGAQVIVGCVIGVILALLVNRYLPNPFGRKKELKKLERS